MNTKKAIRLNRYYGQYLGWAQDRAKISALLGFPNQSLAEEHFARQVAAYQKKNRPLVIDGILGPNTWSTMSPTVAFTKVPVLSNKPAPPKPPRKRRVIYREGDVTAAELEINDAYDLTLIEMTDGNFELVMFMKLQFFFEDSGSRKWKPTDKTKYVKAFCDVVAAHFNGRVIGNLYTGEAVKIRLKFMTQIEGFMADHWELSVRFADPGDRSYVQPLTGNVVLSDQDLKKITRFSCNPSKALCGPIKQTTAIHEFAHMIGLKDEYGPKWGGKVRPGSGDETSLLNIGSHLRPRHTKFLMDWVKDAIINGK